MKFRKKPVVIEAWQSFKDAGTRTFEWPTWIVCAISAGIIYDKDGEVYIKTLEGDFHVSDGDWIIRGFKVNCTHVSRIFLKPPTSQFREEREMSLCIICHTNDTTVPDRNSGSNKKKLCSNCHAERLKNDLREILAIAKRRRNDLQTR